METEIRCIVQGKVQKVGFRDFTQRIASDLTIYGWVKNEQDGTVYVCAQGSPDNLKAFIEELHEGSVLAEVSDVAVEWASPKQLFEDFVVVYS